MDLNIVLYFYINSDLQYKLLGELNFSSLVGSFKSPICNYCIPVSFRLQVLLVGRC